MKPQELIKSRSFSGGKPALVLAAAALAMTLALPGTAAAPKAKPAAKAAATQQKLDEALLALASNMTVTLGKSTLLRLPTAVSRMSVGNPAVADVILISPREIYILGKTVGATNVILWTAGGQTAVIDITVGMDTASLQGKLQLLMPNEKDIKVSAAADSLVLTGKVADAMKVDRAVALAEAYGGKKVVNLLRVSDPQQVMLEVKVAEVSKTLVDKLGAKFNMSRTNGTWAYTLLSSFLTGTAGAVGPASIGASKVGDPTKAITLDASLQDGLVKILAEPNIMAISGQEGAFLAGGKILIPVAQGGGLGITTITLEEREFGVGLRFTPTVLENGRINLRVTPEVSELSQSGTSVTSGGSTSVLPTITTRRATTTIQLNDGQSFAIGGLIKNNVTENINRLPILGDIPILGVLFRSTEFQNDRSELMFVVTPRLVKPLPPDYKLPTDAYIQPTPSELFLEGKLEGGESGSMAGAAPPPAGSEPAPATGRPGGFEMK